MSKQGRNVVGDERMWSGMIPGMGLMNYILGLMTVPVEVFLRRDFGERYFTRMNFIGGLIIMLVWMAVGSLFGLIGMLNPLRIFAHSHAPEPDSWMPGFVRWYVLFSIGHFLFMWYRDVTNKPVHSFSAGRSWLRPVGRVVMWILNLFLNLLVRLIFVFLPSAEKRRLPSMLPVLQNTDTFTERFIEPVFVFFFAFVCFAFGQHELAYFSFFSIMALNLSTGLRHQAERNLFLDYRDQMLDARMYQQVLSGNEIGRSTARERMVQETAREVEKKPDVLPIITAQNPSLAQAIEQISPKLRAMAERETGKNGEQSQTA